MFLVGSTAVGAEGAGDFSYCGEHILLADGKSVVHGQSHAELSLECSEYQLFKDAQTADGEIVGVGVVTEFVATSEERLADALAASDVELYMLSHTNGIANAVPGIVTQIGFILRVGGEVACEEDSVIEVLEAFFEGFLAVPFLGCGISDVEETIKIIPQPVVNGRDEG